MEFLTILVLVVLVWFVVRWHKERTSKNAPAVFRNRPQANIEPPNYSSVPTPQPVAARVPPELEYHIRMVNDSIEIIENSTEASTMMYRLAFLEQNLKEVLRISPDSETANKLQAMLPEMRSKIHTRAVLESVKKFRNKADLSKQASTKQKYAKEALIAIDEAVKAGIADQKSISEPVEGLHRYIAQVEIDEYVEKAKRYEFKGNKNKALEFYKDALFSALNDDIPDEEQSEVIDQLKTKIAELEQA